LAGEVSRSEQRKFPKVVLFRSLKALKCALLLWSSPFGFVRKEECSIFKFWQAGFLADMRQALLFTRPVKFVLLGSSGKRKARENFEIVMDTAWKIVHGREQ
jgi:hypothetical protein